MTRTKKMTVPSNTKVSIVIADATHCGDYYMDGCCPFFNEWTKEESNNIYIRCRLFGALRWDGLEDSRPLRHAKCCAACGKK